MCARKLATEEQRKEMKRRSLFLVWCQENLDVPRPKPFPYWIPSWSHIWAFNLRPNIYLLPHIISPFRVFCERDSCCLGSFESDYQSDPIPWNTNGSGTCVQTQEKLWCHNESHNHVRKPLAYLLILLVIMYAIVYWN